MEYQFQTLITLPRLLSQTIQSNRTADKLYHLHLLQDRMREVQIDLRAIERLIRDSQSTDSPVVE